MIDEILEEMWEYGFNSNGDFPTEHTSTHIRVSEQKDALFKLITEQVIPPKQDIPFNEDGSELTIGTGVGRGYNIAIDEMTKALKELFGGQTE